MYLMNRYKPMMANDIRIGIDLGGTKIEAIALDHEGQEIYRQRIPTPKGNYKETLEAIGQLVQGIDQLTGVRGSVGVGIPGAISAVTGKVKNANSICLIGQDLSGDLQKILERPVTLANDANCFVLSEATDGSGAGASIVFGVILGTGVGGAIAIEGHLLTGLNSIAGEWGHNPLPWADIHDTPSYQCFCGKFGCIESFLCGPALSKMDGRGLSAAEIVTLQDEHSQKTLSLYEVRLAKALAHIINILDPHVIVLGGGLSHITRLYQTVPKLWGEWVFSDRVETELLPPRHGDSSGVRGAAWLGKRPSLT
jgi:fructokinase